MIGIRVVHEFGPLAQALCGVTGPLTRKINDRRANHRPHVQVHGCFRNDLREEILVTETGAPGQQHFGDRQPGTVAHHLGADPALLDRPHTFAKPAFKRHIVRDTSEQRHRGMRVGIHKARDEYVIGPLYQYAGSIPLPRFGCRQQVDDFAVVDSNRVLGQDEIVWRHRYTPAGHDKSVAMLHYSAC